MVINGQGLSEKDVFSAIDNVLIQLNDDSDFGKATDVLNKLDKLNNITGKAKAYLLWGMNLWHSKNRQDDFTDHILSTTTIRNRKTVLEYMNVWEQIEQENIPKHIQERPMRELVPISNMLAQGFSPSKQEWNKINLCSNLSELGEVISKIKGKKRRKNARTIVMERDGSLNLWKDNQKKYLGYLDVKESESDKDVAEAIEYILSGKVTRR